MSPMSPICPAVSCAPLTGMRVVDLSQQLPGPYTTVLLAAMGAEVIKVEPPGGDAARELDPAMFEAVNRGKRSLRLDLKSTEGRDALGRLVRDADVFVEGFRPGVADRLGFGRAHLAKLNDHLVYCSISGFGQTGPLARTPTHDLNLQALAGALPPGQAVQGIGVPWVDLGVATTAAFLIVSHWQARQPAYLDLAMLDVAASWSRVKPQAVADREPSYGTFVARDGEVLVLALLEDAMWSRLCDALGLTAWSDEEDLGAYHRRQARADVVRARLQRAMGERDGEVLRALADEFDLPITAVADRAAADEHEQLRVRGRAGDPDGVLPLGRTGGTGLAPLVDLAGDAPAGEGWTWTR